MRLINSQQPQAKVIVLVCFLEHWENQLVGGSPVFFVPCLCATGSY